MRRWPLLLLLVLLLTAASCSPQSAANSPAVTGLDDRFDRAELVIVSRDGTRHTLNVYLALNSEQHRRGLMFVRDLPKNTGMLFVYEDAGMRSMWMKNTYISLDMVFARADGTVSSVIRDTKPLSLDSQSAIEPVSYVLELHAGATRRLNIGPGSQLLWDGSPGT